MVHVLALSWHVVKHKKRDSSKPKGCLPVTHTASHAYTICTAGARGGSMLEDWLIHQSRSRPSLTSLGLMVTPTLRNTFRHMHWKPLHQLPARTGPTLRQIDFRLRVPGQAAGTPSWHSALENPAAVVNTNVPPVVNALPGPVCFSMLV